MTRGGPADRTDRASETQRRIVDAGMVVFARYGFRQANMELIADEAGLSRPGLYNHVQSKEALFAAVVEAIQVQTMAAAVAAAQSARDAGCEPAALLSAILVARLTAYQAVLSGSHHVAELTDEQGRQCGALVQRYREGFKLWLVEVVEDERNAGRLLLSSRISSAELVDDIYSVAIGVKATVASSAEFAARIQRIITRIIDGGSP